MVALVVLPGIAGCATDRVRERAPVIPDEVLYDAPPDQRDYPTRRPSPLTEDEVLRIARAGSEASAIARLDRHPFSFELDDAGLARLSTAGLRPNVLDYLRKRALIDWETLHDLPEPSPLPEAPAVISPAEGQAWIDSEELLPLVEDEEPEPRLIVVEERTAPAAVWFSAYGRDPWFDSYNCPPYRSYGSRGYGRGRLIITDRYRRSRGVYPTLLQRRGVTRIRSGRRRYRQPSRRLRTRMRSPGRASLYRSRIGIKR